jgi:hypothetical protein
MNAIAKVVPIRDDIQVPVVVDKKDESVRVVRLAAYHCGVCNQKVFRPCERCRGE